MPTAQPLRTGDPQRLGEYQLSGRLGEGGQGAVFLGSRGGETYAVKLLHGPVGDERAAFLREVELAKHVARFCTAQVIDAGFDEGRPYIVSEYVDGPSLHREVTLTGPRRGGALERLAVSTATALAAIHRAGIVHRDFKPQNVLLGPDGPRVIDFGLAKALDAAATVSGRGVGTPAYMAPEQITAEAVTGAADVFSWGATMCFAANASAPFGQDSVAPVLHRILTAPPSLGELDGRLRTLVAACLDKDARNRPSSRELLFELLGESSAEVPAEVLRSPPAPLATPEVTGLPGGYVLSGSSGERIGTGPTEEERSHRSWPRAEERSHRGWPRAEERSHRGWPRAAIAVCAALLATAAVLLIAVMPAMTRRGENQSSQAVDAPTPPPTSHPLPSSKPPTPTPTHTRGPREQLVTVRPPATVEVPSLTGMDRSAAGKALKNAGLVPGAVTEVDAPQRIGQVLSSSPASGTVVNKGATVTLQVSKGIAVPALTGMRRRTAEATLTAAGLKVGAVTSACSQEPTGRVLATQPRAGRRLTGGSAVSLTVARNGAAVPSVVNQSQAAARDALTAAGFTAQTKEQVVEDDSRVGVVLAQSTPPNTCADSGSTIVLTVGAAAPPGPDPHEPTQTPTVPPSGTDRGVGDVARAPRRG